MEPHPPTQMIGILGGSFDPIHFGHLRPALDILEIFDLQELRFIPLNVAVHRPQPAASGPQRLEMVRAGIQSQPGFAADGRELERAGGSYSYDTLVSLRDELGPEVPICLMIGADAFRAFSSWYRPEGILDLAHLVVMQRPGAEPAADPAGGRWPQEPRVGRPDELRSARGGHILVQEVTQLDVSATAIRDLIRRGRSPRFLLPDPVLEIIEREGLYR
jgi:nicotinate-nucleotide adenylyltransferase